MNYLSVVMKTVPELSTDTAPTNDYLFGPGIDEPLARRASAGSTSYYVVDGLGSVIALASSSSGQFTSAASYDEWGMVTTHTVDLFGYAGREVATPTNSTLWFNRARYYAPNWGRFISEDPLRFQSGDENWYDYAANDPVDERDPLGLAPFLLCESDGDVISKTVVEAMTTQQVGPLIKVNRRRRIVQRICDYRCYCNRPNNCYNTIPGHAAFHPGGDHGVNVRLTINEKPAGSGVRPCSKYADRAVAQGNCEK